MTCSQTRSAGVVNWACSDKGGCSPARLMLCFVAARYLLALPHGMQCSYLHGTMSVVCLEFTYLLTFTLMAQLASCLGARAGRLSQHNSLYPGYCLGVANSAGAGSYPWGHPALSMGSNVGKHSLLQPCCHANLLARRVSVLFS